MRCLGHVRWSAPLLPLLIIGSVQATAAQGTPTASSVPAATVPIPVTPTSYPLMAASKIQNLVDLPDDKR